MTKAVHSQSTDKSFPLSMKLSLLLTACLLLAGCCHETDRSVEVLSKLDALKSELGKQPTPTPVATVRWATVDRFKVMTPIYQFTRDKAAELNKAEALPPEIEAQFKAYEALKAEQLRLIIRALPQRPLRATSGSDDIEPSPVNTASDELTKRIAEAKAPIAEIVDRRERVANQLREQYSIEHLIENYAKGRYDVVLESHNKALYQVAADVPDITENVIALFKEKTK